MKLYNGKRIGALTVRSVQESSHGRRVYVKCDCGVVRWFGLYDMARGKKRDCGCHLHPRRRFEWTPEQEAVLRAKYPHRPTAEVAREIGRTTLSCYQHADKLGLKKTAEFRASPLSGILIKGTKLGAEFRFKKGQAAHNKGKKGWCPAGAEKGWFQKGGDPHDTLFDGAIAKRTEAKRDGTLRPYLWIRISRAKWRMWHVVLWEKHVGQIPAGHIVVFKDGNGLNCRLDNLELITREESMRRMHCSDEMIALKLAMVKGKGRGKYDLKLRDYLLHHRKDLIEAKRQQHILRQQVHERLHE